MKLNKKYLIIPVWFILIYIFYRTDLITFDTSAISRFLAVNTRLAALIFLALWLIRIIVFVPGVTLMVLGGVCFGPLYGFLLSFIGIILSETIIYTVSKTFIASKFKNIINRKYPDISLLMEKHDYKFLALGIICPVAPTDAVCFISASTGIKFVKYILTVAAANIPVIILYSYIGLGYKGSIYSIALAVLSISITTLFTVKTWYNLNRAVRLD